MFSVLFILTVGLAAGAPMLPNSGDSPQFPWPYPPEFENFLPQWAKIRLIEIFQNPTLRSEDRSVAINSVFDSLPWSVSSQLPLPIGYERLPAPVLEAIRSVHTSRQHSWNQRQQIIGRIVDSLSEAEKSGVNPKPRGGPPPGFEKVLAPTVYRQLMAVHSNQLLNKDEKAAQITRIMHNVPQEQIERLPLPMGMERLPMPIQKQLRSLIYNYNIPQPLRAQRVRDYVQNLPAEIRPPLR